MNLANWLTLFRLFLLPIFTFAVLLDVPGGAFIGAVVFAVASITDGLDGYIARSRKEVTKFGKLMDPIADKLLVTAALLCLVQLGQVSAWPALIIIGREFAVSGLRMIAASEELSSVLPGGEGEDCITDRGRPSPALAAVLGEPLLVVHRGGNRRLWCALFP